MKKITLIFILLLSGITIGFSQNYNMANGTINAGCAGNFYDPGGPNGNHGNNQNITETFCAQAGQYLTFTFTQFTLGNNDYLYVYDGSSTSAPLIGNFTETTNPGVLCTSTPGGCITFVFHSNGSSNKAGWKATLGCSATPVGNAAGTGCGSANPFCTGTTYNFPNITGNPTGLGGSGLFNSNPSSIYGCLEDTPNPVWYYLQIANPGNIDIGISQVSNGGTPIDVDFILWGPFSSLSAGCGGLSTSNDIDCSYDPSPTEEANITGAQTGEFYILLLTNYDGAAGHIIFSQTNSGPGAGSTNCNIICNVTPTNSGPVCTGSTFNLSASTVSGATYTWTGPGLPSGGQVGQNLTGLTPPTTPGTYTYTVAVASGSNTNCTATTTLTVNAAAQVNPGTASNI
ncbi:MAG TPA: CUB domain-containing protein, partial [Bacteroidia bacterium]